MKKDFYIISYDIGNPKRLNKTREFLKDYGTSVQKSVFECWLTEKEIKDVIQHLKLSINPRKDRIRIYKLCKNCLKRVEFSGIDDSFNQEPPNEVII